MIRNVLEGLGGIGLYGITALLLFFAVFTGMLVWAFRIKGRDIETMKNLPFDESDLHNKEIGS